jgi:prepilin-type N-terminal cleavage/methylation domain-containing protein
MKKQFAKGFTLVEIMVVVAIIGLLAAAIMPNLRRAIATAQTRACSLNRKNIDAAKMQWALETRQPPTAEPTDADLFGSEAYLEHKPDCPAGGAYALNAVQQKCTCNLPPHHD